MWINSETREKMGWRDCVPISEKQRYFIFVPNKELAGIASEKPIESFQNIGGI